MSEQKQPKVRFSGFDDAWEQCTLKDVSARITRKNSNLESNLPLTISAQDGLVDQNTFFGKTIASKDTTGYFLLKKGEFAYNKSYSKGYPFGAVKRLDKYDEGVLSTLYIVFAPRHISSTFLAVYYDSKSWYKEIYRNAAEGARNHGLLNISSSDFFDSKLTIPSDKNEQRFIGRFIKTIDKLIAANQRQLEELKTIKKLAMQKIFDQEWRFNGFTDAWEQRKLGQIANIVMGQSPSSINYTDNPNDAILVQGNADMKNGLVNPRVWTTQITKQANSGSIILSVRAPVGEVGKTEYDVVLGRGVAAISGGEFLFQYLKKMNIKGYWSKYSTGSTFESINSNDIINANISVPSKNEQQLVGKFFFKLDNLIAANQSKSEQLKKLKKWFMQNMFM
ncbi:restriction endonuclease subunit S [Pediococcus inopinatus]|uniref:restriction endonuclease subunit S n=2 Tax=Pediococcus inopinatus TaxID=114090 RepID=UPI000D00680E|nr:restriction endonuclease subunit S [Pediococcus inopinatus]AVK99169.1 hypothetical protein PI20285_00065 [Pediococcus inopinatus]